MKSLKALQVKICDLESERAIAAERFKCLQEEAGREALDTDVHGTPHVPWSRSDACTTTSANKHGWFTNSTFICCTTSSDKNVPPKSVVPHSHMHSYV